MTTPDDLGLQPGNHYLVHHFFGKVRAHPMPGAVSGRKAISEYKKKFGIRAQVYWVAAKPQESKPKPSRKAMPSDAARQEVEALERKIARLDYRLDKARARLERLEYQESLDLPLPESVRGTFLELRASGLSYVEIARRTRTKPSVARRAALKAKRLLLMPERANHPLRQTAESLKE